MTKRLWSPERVIPEDDEIRQFLLERSIHGDATWVGMSSTAMLWHAIMKADGYPDDWPMDQWDLGRCEETYKRAPQKLKRRMLPILKQFRRHVAEGGLYCVGCDTNGHSSTHAGHCRECAPDSFAAHDRFIDALLAGRAAA
jgi:hypothetical protein